MSDTKWYIVPNNGITNETVSAELVQASIMEESIAEIKVDGEKIFAWELPHRYITKLKNNQDIFNFAYTVYVKEGGGNVRRWNLQNKAKKKLPNLKTARELMKKNEW